MGRGRRRSERREIPQIALSFPPTRERFHLLVRVLLVKGIRASFFFDQSQTLILDGHLWSFFAAGDNRPDVYVGLLASPDLSPEHIPPPLPRPPPAADG